MRTIDKSDEITFAIEVRENVLLSTIPILPGGMVDVALSEFDATIVDVCLDEMQIPLESNEPNK